MTRNLYLGADTALALQKLPDLSAAAQAMWDQVAATDFTRRVDGLARDIAQRRPMVLGLQEATVWECLDATGTPVPVFDFTTQLLDTLTTRGTPYRIASAGGKDAVSPGYAIPPIAGATIVHDPATLQPAIGLDAAACGLRIADVLAVRADLAGDVTAVGSTTFDAKTAVGGVLPVMGDFNSDPRDPRAPTAANPGEQPVASAACPDRRCSPYWLMLSAGFRDAGPDATDPRNFTWGADATLAGPSLQRLGLSVTMTRTATAKSG